MEAGEYTLGLPGNMGHYRKCRTFQDAMQCFRRGVYDGIVNLVDENGAVRIHVTPADLQFMVVYQGDANPPE